MSRLVVAQFVTVDGVIDSLGGEPGFDRGGWAPQSNHGEEGDKFKLEELLAADALPRGRVTYESFAAAWPSMSDECGFADKMNGMPRFVVSTTLESPLWNNSTTGGRELAELRDLSAAEFLDMIKEWGADTRTAALKKIYRPLWSDSPRGPRRSREAIPRRSPMFTTGCVPSSTTGER